MLVGPERFELCRLGRVRVLDPTIISRVLLGVAMLQHNRAELRAHTVLRASPRPVLTLSRNPLQRQNP